jgi:hypothetical protein
MGGGLMQLVAYGAQDIYLTGNPQITFFKVVYRRHTNFSMESIEQTFNGQVDFGRKVTCTISRNGDLIHRVYLQVTLPDVECPDEESCSKCFRWVNYVGHALIKSVEVEIGGQRIDKHYGDWLNIWNELTQEAGHQVGYDNMVGNTIALTGTGLSRTNATTLYVPLQFWFCRNPGLALPLIALQYHEVKISLEFRPKNECFVTKSAMDGTCDASGCPVCVPSLEAGSLYVDYIYLDTDERRRFAQVSHEYLIEQLQFTGDESTQSTNVKLKLNFNHPCKELVWVVQRDDVVNNGFNQWSNYTDDYDNDEMWNGMPADHGINSNVEAGYMAQSFPFTSSSDSADAVGLMSDGVNFPPGFGPGSLANSGAPTNFAALTTAGQYDDHAGLAPLNAGRNPVVRAKLQLNGHDRFSERLGSYFNLVQPYQHHTNVPATGINVYSFALKPEEHQPSGTCNMSRIDNAVLQLQLTLKAAGQVNMSPASMDYPQTSAGSKIRVYATNYNVLRIMSGMGGLAYSN